VVARFVTCSRCPFRAIIVPSSACETSLSRRGAGTCPSPRKRAGAGTSARAYVSNLPGGVGVIPATPNPIPEGGRIMFDTTLRRPLVSLALVTGMLVAAGPAAADQPGRHRSDRQELTRRIKCAVANGWLDQRPVKVIARAFKAGDKRTVNAIAAADPQVCMAGNRVGIGRKSALSSHTRPSVDGIIAVLIGLNHAHRSPGIAGDGLQVPDVVAPQTDPRASGFTPPIGTDKGSRTLRSTP
jgi:hypothetical protein